MAYAVRRWARPVALRHNVIEASSGDRDLSQVARSCLSWRDDGVGGPARPVVSPTLRSGLGGPCLQGSSKSHTLAEAAILGAIGSGGCGAVYRRWAAAATGREIALQRSTCWPANYARLNDDIVSKRIAYTNALESAVYGYQFHGFHIADVSALLCACPGALGGISCS